MVTWLGLKRIVGSNTFNWVDGTKAKYLPWCDHPSDTDCTINITDSSKEVCVFSTPSEWPYIVEFKKKWGATRCKAKQYMLCQSL